MYFFFQIFFIEVLQFYNVTPQLLPTTTKAKANKIYNTHRRGGRQTKSVELPVVGEVPLLFICNPADF